MIRPSRQNIPQGPVVDRRVLVGVAGAAVVGCAAMGVRNVLGAGNAERLEVFVENSVPADCSDRLVQRLAANFQEVNLTSFSNEDMDAGSWGSLVPRDASWLVLGANEEGAAALAESGCHEWAEEARGMGETLAFSFGEDETMFALPIEGSLGMLLWNMDLLASLGVGTASDVNSLAAICDFLAESGVLPLALERVDAGSASVGLALDSSLVCWSDGDSPKPVSEDDAVALLAASILRCGRRDGSSPFETREDALASFAAGEAAMVIASSAELDALAGIGFSCTATSLPSFFGEGTTAFRPTKSLACSSGLPGAAYEAVLDWLQNDVTGVPFGDVGSVASTRNEEGGLAVQDLPASVYLSLGPTILLGSGRSGAANRQGLVEKIVDLWSQEEIEQVTYVDETEFEA